MHSIRAMPERTEEAIRRRLERLRERLGAEPDEGWLFARIAAEVAERRLALGFSQSDLARLVGTTQSAIARLEAGNTEPTIPTLRRYAEATGKKLRIDLAG